MAAPGQASASEGHTRPHLQPRTEQGLRGHLLPAPGPSSSETPASAPKPLCSQSERQLLLYEAEALAGGPLAVLGLDVAPSTLLPSYDPDTGLVLLTGKVGWAAGWSGR